MGTLTVCYFRLGGTFGGVHFLRGRERVFSAREMDLGVLLELRSRIIYMVVRFFFRVLMFNNEGVRVFVLFGYGMMKNL